MDLSVIIVCYKGWGRLNNCLEALDTFTQKSFSMEVIVVDNNSGDGKINDLESKFSRFRFIKTTINGGYAYGCNLGAASASGNVFMILNPDTIVNEDAIGKLLRLSIAHPEYYIISFVFQPGCGFAISTGYKSYPPRLKGCREIMLNNLPGLYLKSFVCHPGTMT